MKYTIILGLVAAFVVISYVLTTPATSLNVGIDNQRVDDPEINSSHTTNVEVVYETSTYEQLFPNGEVILAEVEVPYVLVYNQRLQVFETIAGLRIDQYIVSPTGKYVFFSVGNGNDAAVMAHVYDVESKTLHPVCVEEVDCANAYNGFSQQAAVDVSWQNDQQLLITYDNPFLEPGASESDAAIGLQYFESVENESPWIIAEVSA